MGNWGQPCHDFTHLGRFCKLFRMADCFADDSSGRFTMETSLHRDLKTLYADQDAQFEVSLDGYRIDVISDGRLVEIQHGSLAAIRDKVKVLLKKHRVVVVKPIVARKVLVKRSCKDGPVTSRRLSPKRGTFFDL